MKIISGTRSTLRSESWRIRDDEVIVLTGKDKGKRGKVKNVLSSGKLVVEGINLVKKHQKPVPALNQPGGIVEKEAAIQGF